MIVGKYTYGQNYITVHGKDSGYQVKIGAFCSIGRNITIYVGDNHRKDWVTTFPFGHIHKGVFTKFNGTGHPSSNGDVIIGNDVWIASNVTIMSGVTIGNGAIIANNSHVVKDVEPYSIVGGNPARFISYRFTPEQIELIILEKRIKNLLPPTHKHNNKKLNNELTLSLKLLREGRNNSTIKNSLLKYRTSQLGRKQNQQTQLSEEDNKYLDMVLTTLRENPKLLESELSEADIVMMLKINQLRK